MVYKEGSGQVDRTRFPSAGAHWGGAGGVADRAGFHVEVAGLELEACG